MGAIGAPRDPAGRERAGERSHKMAHRNTNTYMELAKARWHAWLSEWAAETPNSEVAQELSANIHRRGQGWSTNYDAVDIPLEILTEWDWEWIRERIAIDPDFAEEWNKCQ